MLRSSLAEPIFQRNLIPHCLFSAPQTPQLRKPRESHLKKNLAPGAPSPLAGGRVPSLWSPATTTANRKPQECSGVTWGQREGGWTVSGQQACGPGSHGGLLSWHRSSGLGGHRTQGESRLCHSGLGSWWSHPGLTKLTWTLWPSAGWRRGAELQGEGSHVRGGGERQTWEEASKGRIF